MLIYHMGHLTGTLDRRFINSEITLWVLQSKKIDQNSFYSF